MPGHSKQCGETLQLPRRAHSAFSAVIRPTRLVAAIQAGVLTLLVAGVATYTVFDRTVSLEVDGETQDVRILGSGVDDVLAEAGVEVGARDLVSPSTDENVADGDTVVVRHARPLTVGSPDGSETTYWTTSLTVDDALQDIGVRAEGAWMSASRSASIGRSGLDLEVSLPKDVTVLVDGETRPVTSAMPTVDRLLEEQQIELGPEDRLSADPGDAVTAGQQLTIQRVLTSEAVEAVEVPVPVRNVTDDSMYTGETTVVEAGSPGRQEVTFRVVTVDGVEESRVEVARATTAEVAERVVATGTKARPAPKPAAPKPAAPAPAPARAPAASAPAASAPVPAASSGAEGLNWAALAACESGGNPSIVSSTGKYHGLYQFSVATWNSVGGSGLPSQASASEQTARAQALYSRSGAGQWPSCGPRLFR